MGVIYIYRGLLLNAHAKPIAREVGLSRGGFGLDHLKEPSLFPDRNISARVRVGIHALIFLFRKVMA